MALPVAPALPKGYLSPEARESISWIADGKPIFSMRARVESAVHTHDPSLAKFFAYAANNESASQDAEKLAQVKCSYAFGFWFFLWFFLVVFFWVIVQLK